MGSKAPQPAPNRTQDGTLSLGRNEPQGMIQGGRNDPAASIKPTTAKPAFPPPPPPKKSS